MEQQWLPAVPLEAAAAEKTVDQRGERFPLATRTGNPVRVVAASAPAAGAVREAPGAGAAGTRGERRHRRPELPQGYRYPTADELAELDALIAELEWAADGGDGSVCSTGELDEVPALNLEWILHGALLEAMAAVIMDVARARPSRLEQSEISRGAAA